MTKLNAPLIAKGLVCAASMSDVYPPVLPMNPVNVAKLKKQQEQQVAAEKRIAAMKKVQESKFDEHRKDFVFPSWILGHISLPWFAIEAMEGTA